MISKVIGTFDDVHPLIKMYNEYITDAYINPINSFYNELFINHNYDILWDAGAQKYLCDKIVYQMERQNVPYLEITNGTSAGRPWTEIGIVKKIDGYWECLFWRVDIRAEKFYIRLNQYADPTEKEVAYKMRRLEILRKEVDSFVANMPELHPGMVNNRATKESEVIIFFLIENDLNKLIEALPKISRYMMNIFNGLP